MRKTFGWMTLGLGLIAQASDNVQVDTPQARAFLETFQPHSAGPLREHPMNRVIVYVTGGQLMRKMQNGSTQKVEFKAGEVRWSPAGEPYMAENTSDQPIQVAVIELKSKPPRPPMPVSKLDPTVVDSKHYKVELDNEQVRVLRVGYGAHEKGAQHEHILNRVVVNVTDQANGKAGEIHMSGAATHAEENALDRAVERIAVELK